MDSYIGNFAEAPAANILFFAICGVSVFTLFSQNKEAVLSSLMFNPYRISRHGEYHRFLTPVFIHLNWPHFLFNMITYFFFVFMLEDRLRHAAVFSDFPAWVGTLKFLALSALTILGSKLPDYIKFKDVPGYNALGASGLISGLLFAVMLYLILEDRYLGLFFIIPIPAWLFPFIYLAYSYWGARHANDGIGHSAHLFGALTGLIAMLALEPSLGPKLVFHTKEALGL